MLLLFVEKKGVVKIGFFFGGLTGWDYFVGIWLGVRFVFKFLFFILKVKDRSSIRRFRFVFFFFRMGVMSFYFSLDEVIRVKCLESVR